MQTPAHFSNCDIDSLKQGDIERDTFMIKRDRLRQDCVLNEFIQKAFLRMYTVSQNRC